MWSSVFILSFFFLSNFNKLTNHKLCARQLGTNTFQDKNNTTGNN